MGSMGAVEIEHQVTANTLQLQLQELPTRSGAQHPPCHTQGACEQLLGRHPRHAAWL